MTAEKAGLCSTMGLANNNPGPKFTLYQATLARSFIVIAGGCAGRFNDLVNGVQLGDMQLEIRPVGAEGPGEAPILIMGGIGKTTFHSVHYNTFLPHIDVYKCTLFAVGLMQFT
jgi:hypothetical protein